MDSMIDFVVANYIWFAVGLVVFTMVIIGYIADKTDFWHKTKKTKKVANPVNETEQVGPTKEELDNLKNKKLEDVVAPSKKTMADLNGNLTEPLTSANTCPIPAPSILTPSLEDLNVPFGDTVSAKTNVSNIPDSTMLNQPIEDLNVPLNIEPSIVKPVDAVPEIKIDSNIVKNDIPEVVIPSISEITPISGIKTVDYVEPVVPEVITEKMNPGIEQATALRIDEPVVKKEPKVQSEEDIWKF